MPFSLLLMGASIVAASYVGKRLGKKAGIEVDAIVWQTLLVGLVMARLTFVWQLRAAYITSPLGILDIRDGGWNPVAGFISAWVFAIGRQLLRPALRRPLLSALAAGTVVWVAGTFATSMPNQAQKLPQLSLATLQGVPIDLTSFRGKPTVINLWATWCPPCVREMPVLYQAQLDHPSANFVFVNQGESSQRVDAWLKARKLPLQNVLLDSNSQAMAALGQRGLPTTLFFDAQGQLASSRTGELSMATLTQRLESLAP